VNVLSECDEPALGVSGDASWYCGTGCMAPGRRKTALADAYWRRYGGWRQTLDAASGADLPLAPPFTQPAAALDDPPPGSCCCAIRRPNIRGGHQASRGRLDGCRWDINVALISLYVRFLLLTRMACISADAVRAVVALQRPGRDDKRDVWFVKNDGVWLRICACVISSTLTFAPSIPSVM